MDSTHIIDKRSSLFKMFIAKQLLKFVPTSRTIAVAGSVGKSTTIEAVKNILEDDSKKILVTATNNNEYIQNFASTLLKVRPNIENIILELGIDSVGDVEFYLKYISPKVLLIPQLEYPLRKNLPNLDDVLNEYTKLINSLDNQTVLILNYDDPLVRKLAEKTHLETIFFGTDKENCHIWAGNIKITNYQTTFELNYGVERVEITSRLLGAHHIYPLLAAAAFGLNLGYPLTRVKKSLEKIEPLEHRLQVFKGFNDTTILDDSFSSHPHSLEKAIETLNYIPARRRILVLSEIKNLGEKAEKHHRDIAVKIFKEKIDLVFLMGGDTNYIADELDKLGFISERMEKDLQNPQAVAKLLKNLAKGDVVLIKGDRTARLDEVAKKIAKK